MSTKIKITGWIISLLVPFILIMAAVRALLTPTFLEIEYHRDNFPPDSYGFTLTDRLKWGGLSVDFLLNNSPISFLEELEITEGHPLYNERELSHMLDVKILVQKSLAFLYLALGTLLALSVLAKAKGWLSEFWSFLARGGLITIILILAVVLGVFIGFDALFTGFHRIFFEGDTWLFYFSDSLIRLFPIQFWQDAFIAMGGITLLEALIVFFGGRYLSKQS